jgi:formylglycine-generating enzyme required for sulfatase activity
VVEVGSVIGNYQILEEVGIGGMGRVFRGLDMMLSREVAIKVLRPELTRHPSLVERFRNEAVVLAKLNHPHIALLYNLIHQDNLLFMVMEFVRGETLDWVIKKSGAMAYGQALRLFGQILEAIRYAHHHGVIHRDLKPNNIMITPEEGVKVMDFGIARVLGTERMTREGSFVGTLEYMAPEQIRGHESSERTDIYALGVLLYEMLSGRLPFTSTNQFDLMQAHIEAPPPPPRAFAPHIPEHVEQAILRALAKRPSDRFSSALEFRDALLKSGHPSLSAHGTKPLRETVIQGLSDAETAQLDAERKQLDAEHRREAEKAAAEARRQLIEEARKRAEQEAARLAEEVRQRLIEEARKQAEAEAVRLVEEERKRLIEEARKQAEQEAARLAEEVRQRLIEEARSHAEQEAAERAKSERLRLVEEARKRAEQEAAERAMSERLRLVEEARKRAEQEAAERAAAERRRLVEEARKRAEQEAAERAAAEQRRLVEEARVRAEQEAAHLAAAEQKRLIDEARRQAEAEAARLAAAERQRLIDEARQQAEAEAARLTAEETQRLVEEARRRAEQEAARFADQERRRLIEEAHKLAEQEAAARASAERKILVEEARKRAEQEAAVRASAERQRLIEDARKQAEIEATRLAAEETQKLTEAALKQAEQEASQFAAEERQRLIEEARRRAEQEASQRASKERQRIVEKARKEAEEEAAKLEEEERQRLIEEALKRAEEEAAHLAEEDRQQILEEARKRAEKEAARRAAKERKRLIAEERKRAKQEAHRQSAELVAVQDPFGTSDLSESPERRSDSFAFGTKYLPPDQSRRRMAFVIGGLLLLGVVIAAFFIFRPGRTTTRQKETPDIKPDMVRIPGGAFRMGRENGPAPGEDESWVLIQMPAHEVTVGPYEIARTEVTNAEYALFVHDTKRATPEGWEGNAPPKGREQWPVSNVTLEDARAFAVWRSIRDGVTYRLPTEAEWEFAAKGQTGYRYPWGNEWSSERANIGTGSPKPVESYPQGASPFGLLDMIGNVDEWTSSPIEPYPGSNLQLRSGSIVRGGNYTDKAVREKPITVTSRGFVRPGYKDATIGFRLVRSVVP